MSQPILQGRQFTAASSFAAARVAVEKVALADPEQGLGDDVMLEVAIAAAALVVTVAEAVESIALSLSMLAGRV